MNIRSHVPPTSGQSIRRFTAALRFIALIVVAIPSAHASTVSWTSPANGDFNTAANWTPTAVPSDTTGAVFNAGGTYTVNFTANASSSNLVVDTDNVTFDLGGNTYSAGRYAGIHVINGATLVVSNGTLRPYATPTATSLLQVDSTSTLRINSGGTLDVSANNGAPIPLYQGWGAGATVVVDGGTFIDMWPATGTPPGSMLVTNGGKSTMYYNYSTTTIVTGPGSQLTLNNDPYAGAPVVNSKTLTVDNGAAFVGAGATYNSTFTVREGSTATVGYVRGGRDVYGDAGRYNVYNGTLTVTGGLDAYGPNRAIELGNYYGTGQMTMSNGIVNIAAGKSIVLVESHDTPLQPFLRGTGTIQRGTVGANISIDNTGLIRPGDFSATPSIGTLAVNNGDLYQTNTVSGARLAAGLRFDFDATLPGAADLIDITGGLISITAGSNVFNNVGGSALAYGTWEFLIADDINYSPQFDNMASLLGSLTTPLPDDIVTFGVVSFNGQEALQLSVVAIPEPSTILLLTLGAAVLWRRSHRRGEGNYFRR